MTQPNDRSPEPLFDRHRIECDLIKLTGQMLYLLGAAEELELPDRHRVIIISTNSVIRLAAQVKKMQNQLINTANAHSTPPDEP